MLLPLSLGTTMQEGMCVWGGHRQGWSQFMGWVLPLLEPHFFVLNPPHQPGPSLHTCAAQLLQKKTTMQFKTLDSTLQTIDANTGRKEATTYRCADIDKMVPSLMGVSKVWGGCGTSVGLLKVWDGRGASVGVSQVWGRCVGGCRRIVWGECGELLSHALSASPLLASLSPVSPL